MRSAILSMMLGLASCAPVGDEAAVAWSGDGKGDGVSQIDESRLRDLEAWLPAISAYSERHYGEPTADLEPVAIVLHYTATATFPWDLVRSSSHAGETPGLGCHYVVDGAKVWRLLPETVRARCAKGANHRAISIEIIARDEADLLEREDELATAAALVADIMERRGLGLDAVYGHQDVDRFDGSIEWVYDLLTDHGSGKIDPGPTALADIKARVARLRGE